MTLKEIAAVLSMIAGLAGGLVYLYGVLKGKTIPHLFSWLIWAVVMGIAAAIQFDGGAGAGAWPTALGAIICLTITALSIKYGEKKIKKSDWIALFMALLALPLWLSTDNPALAASWVTFIDLSGVYPTFRKGWDEPWKENLMSFTIGFVSSALSVCAISIYSIETSLYPVAITIANLALAAMLFFRRRGIAKK